MILHVRLERANETHDATKARLAVISRDTAFIVNSETSRATQSNASAATKKIAWGWDD